MRTPDNNHDDGTWESEMGEEFERRVRDLHAAPLDLGAVKGTARRIRTKRRATIAGGILAAAAVIVPIAVLATNSSTKGAEGIDPADVPSAVVTDPAPPTPAPESTPTPTPEASSPPGDLSAGFGYVETGSGDAVLHQSDGGTLELPGPDYIDVAALGSTIAAYRFDAISGEGAVDLIDDGAVTTTYVVRSAMATTPDGLSVAFITTDDVLTFVNDTQEQDFGPVDPGVNLAAIIGDGDCALESGCHPFLDYQDFSRDGSFEINYEGPETEPAPGAIRVHDADDDFLVSVMTEAEDTTTCGGLYDRQDASWVFQTCDYQVHEISPDGTHTIGLPSYFDGLGTGTFYLLDDQGSALVTVDDGLVGDTAWIDDDTAVATVFVDGQWQIISVDLDGTQKVLVEGAAGDEVSPPYHLTARD